MECNVVDVKDHVAKEHMTMTKNYLTKDQLILKFVYVVLIDMLLSYTCIECLVLLFAMSLNLDFHVKIILWSTNVSLDFSINMWNFWSWKCQSHKMTR